VPCESHFTDVPVDYWAFGYIKWAYCHRIVSGYADHTFRPDANVTRGQVAKMVVLAAGFPLTLPVGAPHVSNVPPGHPFYTYVEVAPSHGVLSGYADGTFRPAAHVTRAQLAKMIVQARGYALVTPAIPAFSDVPLDYWAYSYIETARAHTVVGGYADGTCRPAAEATRAQLCKMIYQACGLPGR
jgi:S-layer homology domain